jgi:hypothetical protein
MSSFEKCLLKFISHFLGYKFLQLSLDVLQIFSILTQNIWKYFLPFCTLSLHFIDYLFAIQKFFLIAIL